MQEQNENPFSTEFTSFLLLKFLKGFSVNKTDKLIDHINVQEENSKDEYKRKCNALYLLFGNFDVLCINTVPYLYNHIIPANKAGIDDRVITSCNYAGLTFNYDPSILNFGNDYPFVAFTQVKLNSYYFLSSPEYFLKLVVQKIHEICEKNNSKVIINYSFSSYELSLCQLSDSLIKMEEVIRTIRTMDFNLEEVENLELIKFYNALGETIDNKTKRHFISDTLTHYGIKIIEKETFIPQDKKKEYEFINFKESLEDKHQNVFFYLDFKVKPGHIPQFLQGLKKYPNINKYIIETHRFTSGRLDLELKEIIASEYYSAFLDLQKLKVEKELRSCIRDMYTKIAFSHQESNYTNILPYENGSYSHIELLEINGEKLADLLDIIYKEYSFDMYSKVSKMFSYYNNAIHNPLTFNLYIDFYNFLQHFVYNFQTSSIKVNLEKLDAFDRAHYVRHFHESYSDEGTELLLGTNIPVQGLSSDIDIVFKIVYDEIFKFLATIDDNNHASKNYYTELQEITGSLNPMPNIVYIHDIKPYASGISVNFNIPSIFNPEIFFNYLIKEAAVVFFNTEAVFAKGTKKLFSSFYQYFNEYKIRHVFTDPKTKAAFDGLSASYFIEDLIRYVVLFDCKFSNYLNFHVLSIAQAWKEMDTNDKYQNERLLSEMFRWLFVFQVDYIYNEGDSFDIVSVKKEFKEALLQFKYFDNNEFADSYNIVFSSVEKMDFNFWNKFCIDKGCRKAKIEIGKIIKIWAEFKSKNDSIEVIELMQKHMQSFFEIYQNGISPNPKGGFNFVELPISQNETNRQRYNELVTRTMMSLSNIVYEYRYRFILKLKENQNTQTNN